jgi:rhodanese-related sulfurtransferase
MPYIILKKSVHMKKHVYILILAAICVTSFITPNQTIAASSNSKAKTTVWKPQTPEGYRSIKWTSARGVASFMKAPTSTAGFIDYLTLVYLPYNEIRLIASSTPRIEWASGTPPLDNEAIRNWAFTKMVTDQAKDANPKATFFWDMPFHNVTLNPTDLSFALKSKDKQGTYLTSGSRPEEDMLEPRRLLIINNKTGLATTTIFDETIFKTSKADQIFEGFDPTVVPRGSATTTARLYIGVKPNGKEIVVYCSRGASPSEASDALLAAGVPLEGQVQADGGNSTTCGYNLPGQYFVEPGRMLPHLMASFPKK